MTARPAPVPDRVLELFVLGELDARRAVELAERLRGDAALAARVEELRASDREILGQHPAAQVAAEVRRRSAESVALRVRAAPPRRTGPRRPLLFLAAPALAGALGLALWVRPWNGEDGAEERVKGARPQLLVLAVRQAGAERLADGAPVVPGEAIQLAYAPAGMPYGAIVSVDGRGVVTLHWPEDARQPARLQAQSQVVLPHAFQLDDAPGFERFTLVAAREPVDVARVLRAAGAAQPGQRLDLPATWVQVSLQLRKVIP